MRAIILSFSFDVCLFLQSNVWVYACVGVGGELIIFTCTTLLEDNHVWACLRHAQFKALGMTLGYKITHGSLGLYRSCRRGQSQIFLVLCVGKKNMSALAPRNCWHCGSFYRPTVSKLWHFVRHFIAHYVCGIINWVICLSLDVWCVYICFEFPVTMGVWLVTYSLHCHPLSLFIAPSPQPMTFSLWRSWPQNLYHPWRDSLASRSMLWWWVNTANFPQQLSQFRRPRWDIRKQTRLWEWMWLH